jgi:hypothetical protein
MVNRESEHLAKQQRRQLKGVENTNAALASEIMQEIKLFGV